MAKAGPKKKHTKKKIKKKLTKKPQKTFERLPDVRFKLINIDFSSDRTVLM